MELCGSCWSGALLAGLLLVTVLVQQGQCAAASEWSLGTAEEYVTAFINLTYMEGDRPHTEKSEVGKFGTGKVGPASGLVVHVHSQNKTAVHDGCEYPYGNQLPLAESWIALVKRGNCSFDKKLENAFRSNASALVVYAREDKDQLEKMTFKNCINCDIPTVFTYWWKGEEIAKNVERGYRVKMYITVGENCKVPYSGINRTSVLFVSISFIVLMIISLAWLVFYYVQRFRYLHAKDRLALRLCYAAKKALAKIPTRNIKLTDKEISGEGECCAVCIELYRSGDTLRTLPCRHEFHKCCVDPWLLEHRTCPMCKMDILKYYGFVFTGSQESILHLDLDEGMLNSSESREIDTPIHETHHHHHHTHTLAQQHHATVLTSAHGHDDHPHSSISSAGAFTSSQGGSMRKASLISLTVVAAPRGTITSPTGEDTEIPLDHDCSPKSKSPQPEIRKSVSKSSLSPEEPVHAFCTVRPTPDDSESCSYQCGVPSSPHTPTSQPLLPEGEECVPVTVHQASSSPQPPQGPSPSHESQEEEPTAPPKSTST